MVGSRWPMRTVTPAARRAASSKRDQPPRLRNTLPGQRSAGTRGGVIARVWRSTRQKLNRPLRSMWALTSEAAPQYYHELAGWPEVGASASQCLFDLREYHGQGQLRPNASCKSFTGALDDVGNDQRRLVGESPRL